MVRGLTIVVNNVVSHQRLVDVAKVVYGFDLPEVIKAFVITRPSGSAAQIGVPEVSKLAYKLGKPLIILPTINDAIELFTPAKVFIVYRTEDSQPLEDVEVSDNSMFVFSCSDVGFTKNELSLGTHVYPTKFRPGIGPAAEVALTLYIVTLKTR
ncbi:MAG: RecB-family nuclease [Desulfurococcaceae archaeon]|jgi:SpoU rRNA methylase family enzyme|nr:RecB-family nuclease [Desulfurococcaceae archaeon]